MSNDPLQVWLGKLTTMHSSFLPASFLRIIMLQLSAYCINVQPTLFIQSVRFGQSGKEVFWSVDSKCKWKFFITLLRCGYCGCGICGSLGTPKDIEVVGLLLVEEVEVECTLTLLMQASATTSSKLLCTPAVHWTVWTGLLPSVTLMSTTATWIFNCLMF